MRGALAWWVIYNALENVGSQEEEELMANIIYNRLVKLNCIKIAATKILDSETDDVGLLR